MIYINFLNVQEDVGEVLPVTAQSKLEKALKDSLEGVGNGLQKTVERLGSEWKTCRCVCRGCVGEGVWVCARVLACM